MTVPKVALGEVCGFVRGVSFDGKESIDVAKEGYVPILRAGNIGDDLYIHEDLVWVPEKRVSKEQYFQVGDIAICMASGSPKVLGKTAQLKESFTGSIGAFCGIIRPIKADPNYISYWLKSDGFMAWRDSQANGVNIQNLRPTEIREIEIPLPPLTEQKRIASLLARADRLRGLRRTAHDLSDALLQSVFLEMFGDPIANPNGWDKVVIEELVSDMRGGSPLEPEDFVDKGFPVLHKGAIKPWGEIELDPKKKTFTNDAFVQKYKRAVINREYVVVTLRDLVPSGPSIGLVSKLTSSPYPEYILAQGAYAFLVNKKKLNADYLMALSNITSFRRFLRTLAVGSTQIHIRNPIYLEIAIPLPPITLQEKFSKVINQLQIVREQRYESERQIEILFQDLMNKVFAEGLNES